MIDKVALPVLTLLNLLTLSAAVNGQKAPQICLKSGVCYGGSWFSAGHQIRYASFQAKKTCDLAQETNFYSQNKYTLPTQNEIMKSKSTSSLLNRIG